MNVYEDIANLTYSLHSIVNSTNNGSFSSQYGGELMHNGTLLNNTAVCFYVAVDAYTRIDMQVASGAVGYWQLEYDGAPHNVSDADTMNASGYLRPYDTVREEFLR